MKREIDKYPNLIPNSERSPEELREMGRKGGIKSGETRRKRREREKNIKMIAKIMMENEETKASLKHLVELLQNK